MRRLRSWPSLKLASTQTSFSAIDREQRRAGLHPLAELHAAPRDVAVDRREQLGAAQREVGLAHARRGAQHVRDLLDRHAFGQRLVRGQLLARRGRARLRRRPAPLFAAASCDVDVVELFLADGAGGDQRRTPRDVVLRPRDVALRARQVGLARRDLRLQRAVVDVQRARLAHRLRQLRFGLVERDPRVGRIELDQRLAGLDEVGVVGGDGDDRAGDLRRELHDVALHVGVVGALVVVEHQRPVGAVGDAAEQHRRPRRPAARCGGGGCRCGRRRGRRGGSAAAAVGGRRGRPATGAAADRIVRGTLRRLAAFIRERLPERTGRRRCGRSRRKRRRADASARRSRRRGRARAASARRGARARRSTVEAALGEHVGLGVEHREVGARGRRRSAASRRRRPTRPRPSASACWRCWRSIERAELIWSATSCTASITLPL